MRIKEVIIIRTTDPDGSMFRAIMDAIRDRCAEVIELTAPAHEIFTFGNIEVYPDRRMVLKAGKELHLNHSEFSMLMLLASAPGRVFSKEQLMAPPGMRSTAMGPLRWRISSGACDRNWSLTQNTPPT